MDENEPLPPSVKNQPPQPETDRGPKRSTCQPGHWTDCFARLYNLAFHNEWWSLIFHRAWIGTLGLAAVGWLLTSQSQARDILLGIGVNLNLVGLFGVYGYALFWLAGSFLALVLVLIVWVTGLPKFDHSSSMMPEHDKRRRRYTAIIFIGTLFAVHFAYILAGKNGDDLIVSVLMAVANMAIIPALVLLPRLLLNWLGASTKWKTGIYSAIATLICSFTLFVALDNGDSAVAAIVSSATPFLAWVAIRFLGLSFPAQNKHSLIWFFVLVSLLWLIVLILVFKLPWPPMIVRTLYKAGSASVAMVWLAWLALTWACLQLAVRRFGRPAVAIIVIVIGVELFFHHEKTGQEWLITDTAAPLPDAPAAAPESGGVEPPSGIPLAIHADGGGLRAALYTAEVLAIADDATCGDFGSHVYAASGVSGGSLGIATWAVMRAEFVRLSKENKIKGGDLWADCKEQRKRAQIPEGKTYWGIDARRPLFNLVRNTLLADHLTAALTSALTTDLLRPAGNAYRGQALLESWQQGAFDALRLVVVDPMTATASAFAATLDESNAGVPNGGPILLFTATVVDNGERTIFSNVIQPQLKTQIGVAVLESARFPLISPPGTILDGDKKLRLVVDGGYFDNSGAATLEELLRAVKRDGNLPGTVVIARIDGNAPNEKDDTRCDDFLDAKIEKKWDVESPFSSFLRKIHREKKTGDESLPSQYSGWSFIDAYWATRSARAKEAVDSLSDSQIQGVVIGPQLHLDYFEGFDENCAAILHENPFYQDGKPYPASRFQQLQQCIKDANDSPICPALQCLNSNESICTGGHYMPKAPLGWYLSQASATALENSAVQAARHLLGSIGMNRSYLNNRGQAANNQNN
ncbi:MAG: hypothetical protein FWG56_12770 [Desulfovibrionaceae bacterium]|nr:hypothetical protein [Desulfovibrionaceae bacterium]